MQKGGTKGEELLVRRLVDMRLSIDAERNDQVLFVVDSDLCDGGHNLLRCGDHLEDKQTQHLLQINNIMKCTMFATRNFTRPLRLHF